MAAIDQTMVSNILNATLPTGTGAIPGTFTGLATSAMKLKLTSTASSASASGTELASGSGYVTGGTAMTTASTASSAGSAVTLPNQTGGITWTNTGSGWSIQSVEITSSAPARVWFGNFTSPPIVVGASDGFNIAQNAISVSLA